MQTNNMDLASHNRSLVTCDRPTTRPGAPVGMLSNDAHGVEGTVYVKDAKTFYIQLFSYDARGTGVCVCVHIRSCIRVCVHSCVQGVLALFVGAL